MFRFAREADRLERQDEPLAAFLLWDLAADIAVLLCAAGGLQDRLRPWHRCRPRGKVGYRSRRGALRRYVRPRPGQRRARAVR